MAFTAKILSWRFRHLNIVVSLLKRRPTQGGGGYGHPRTPLATPLRYHMYDHSPHVSSYCKHGKHQQLTPALARKRVKTLY